MEARILTAVCLIVPLQQLFVLNSAFMTEQARGLVKQLGDGKDDAAKIQKAFLRLYGRPASEREVKMGLDFLAAPEPDAGPNEKPKPLTLDVKGTKQLRITIEPLARFQYTQLILADARVQK